MLRVARRYPDAVTGEQLPVREDFAEALTHDCHVVQVPLLSDQRRNDLEKLLCIFDQRLRTADPARSGGGPWGDAGPGYRDGFMPNPDPPNGRLVGVHQGFALHPLGTGVRQILGEWTLTFG